MMVAAISWFLVVFAAAEALTAAWRAWTGRRWAGRLAWAVVLVLALGPAGLVSWNTVVPVPAFWILAALTGAALAVGVSGLRRAAGPVAPAR